MKNTALITGASNGIGLELARIHASKGGDLVLVARNKSKLDELKNELEKEFKIVVYTIGKDLSAINSAREVYYETNNQNIQIDILINNAGFGDFGLFAETDWSKESEMINLNISTLTLFTKLYLQDMLKKRSGKIMNLASTAAFQPGPMMAVYFATKAYVLSFSEALSNEVRSKGVSVTALCPGPTTSGFQTAASMDNSKLFSNKNLPKSQEVALYGYNAMIKGKTVAIHGIMNTILATSQRFVPRAVVLKISRMILDRS